MRTCSIVDERRIPLMHLIRLLIGALIIIIPMVLTAGCSLSPLKNMSNIGGCGYFCVRICSAVLSLDAKS